LEFSVCGRYIVLLAKNREALLDMMRTLKIFLKDRGMELKSKIMVFNRKGREKKESWTWNKKEIEEVQVFKYLGFVLSNSENYKEHVKELVRKGRMATKRVWGLGERGYVETISKGGGICSNILFRV